MKPGEGSPTGDPLRVLAIVGTRPEAIKMAPVVRELAGRAGIRPVLCLTAQHRDLLEEPLQLFGLSADHDLNLMQKGQSPLELAGRALPALESVMVQARPDAVLVQGDTTTAFCGGLAAYHQQIRVGHIEAGLRTGRRYEPFPEEMNRRLLGPLTDWHFAPTDAARDALTAEGVEARQIFVTGNTVVDALLQVAEMSAAADTPTVACDRRLVLLTCHRRENHGSPMADVFQAVREIVDDHDDVEVVFPVHPNPAVVEAAEQLKSHPRIQCVEPLSYRALVSMLQQASLVLTDSGGIQEEAPTFQVPVMVLRETTERHEGVAAGSAYLVGTDAQRIRETAARLLAQDPAAAGKANNPYGDGLAARRIVDCLWSALSADDGNEA